MRYREVYVETDCFLSICPTIVATFSWCRANAALMSRPTERDPTTMSDTQTASAEQADTDTDESSETADAVDNAVALALGTVASSVIAAGVRAVTSGKQAGKRAHGVAATGIAGVGAVLSASAPAIATVLLVTLTVAALGAAVYVTARKLT